MPGPRWRSEYEARLKVPHFRTRKEAYFGSDVRIDGLLYANSTDRRLVTVGQNAADYTQGSKHYADALNDALAHASDGDVFLRGETVPFPSATGKVVKPLSNIAVRGAGVGLTVIQTTRTDYVFKNTSTLLHDGELSDMTIDCQDAPLVSGVVINNFDNYTIKRVAFKNSKQWFAKFGNEPAASTDLVNQVLLIEDSKFDTHNGIYEMLLAFNTDRVDVNRCWFLNKTGSPGSAPTLGFWQKVNYARVRNSRFENLVGDAIYYGFTVNGLSVSDCDFINVKKGLHGAIVSDFGKFGTKYVTDISVRHCRFVGGSNSTASEAVQIGSVHDFSIEDVQIKGHARGIRIGFGNNVPTSSDGGDAFFPSVGGVISNVTFKDINPLGTNKTLNSPIFFGNGGDFKSLTIRDISIQDDNSYLDYAVIFNGGTTATASLNGGAIQSIAVANTFAWYSTAPTVTIAGDGTGATATASIDSDGHITAINVTNGGSGYTAATVTISGANYKNIRFINCDFGGKKIRVNDSAQVDWDTVTFEDCKNFDTSNLAATTVDKAVRNRSSLIMRDGKFGTGVFDANMSSDMTAHGLIVKRLTTTQRDALAGLTNGIIIYNTTTGKFQGRQTNAWVDLA